MYVSDDLFMNFHRYQQRLSSMLKLKFEIRSTKENEWGKYKGEILFLCFPFLEASVCRNHCHLWTGTTPYKEPKALQQYVIRAKK
jgi:hypothetical protein